MVSLLFSFLLVGVYFVSCVPADPSKAVSDTEMIVAVVIGVLAFVLLLLIILIGIIVRSVSLFTVFSIFKH